MTRKGAGGRFVGEGEAKPVEKKRAVAAPRAKFCRSYTRKRVAEALPEIVETFLTEAKKGSVPHAKALASLGGLDKGDVVPKVKPRRGKSLAGMLMESLKGGAGEK